MLDHVSALPNTLGVPLRVFFGEPFQDQGLAAVINMIANYSKFEALVDVRSFPLPKKKERYYDLC
jgi:hypothetical protein